MPDDVPFMDMVDVLPKVLTVPIELDVPVYWPDKIVPAYCCCTPLSPTLMTRTPSIASRASPY